MQFKCPVRKLQLRWYSRMMSVVYLRPSAEGLSERETAFAIRNRAIRAPCAPRIAFKALADAGGKAVMLVITVVAARRLNADPFGVLAFAMATGWLLGVATDAGLSMHLARETARHPQHGRRFVLEIISLRAGLAFFAATVAVLATPYLVPRHWRLQFVLVDDSRSCAAR